MIEELAAQVQGVWREVLPDDQFGALAMDEVCWWGGWGGWGEWMGEWVGGEQAAYLRATLGAGGGGSRPASHAGTRSHRFTASYTIHTIHSFLPPQRFTCLDSLDSY